MERPTCRTCPYWWWETEAPNSDDEGEASPEVDGNYDHLPGRSSLNTVVDSAECRRRAPAATVEVDGGNLFTQNTSVAWPVTDSIGWCGEHPDFPAYIESLKAGAK